MENKDETLGINNDELWNLDVTFAEFIVPRLKAYKEYNTYSVPILDKKDIPPQILVNLGDDKFYTNDAIWNKILDEMIWTFEFIMDDLDYTDEQAKFFTGYTPTNIGMEIYRLNEERVRQGLEYFARYFRSLWI